MKFVHIKIDNGGDALIRLDQIIHITYIPDYGSNRDLRASDPYPNSEPSTPLNPKYLVYTQHTGNTWLVTKGTYNKLKKLLRELDSAAPTETTVYEPITP